jgi:hypothetical protein
MEKARGDFIARMDADDVALPTRLEQRLKYLLSHTDTVAVGGQCILINKKGRVIGDKVFPIGFSEIYKYSFTFCPAQQPALMFARLRLPKFFNLYDHGMTPVEDMELLFKLYKYGKVENLKEYVLMYRIHDTNSSLRSFKKSFFLTLLSRIRGVLLHGYRPTLSGLFFTIVQASVVFLLPQRLTYLLYRMTRKISKEDRASIRQQAAFRINLSGAV